MFSLCFSYHRIQAVKYFILNSVSVLKLIDQRHRKACSQHFCQPFTRFAVQHPMELKQQVVKRAFPRQLFALCEIVADKFPGVALQRDQP